MSEFRLTGNGYISEWNGDSTNDGTNPNTPWAGPNDAPSSILALNVIGTGVYKGVSTKFFRLIGDGKIIWDFEGLTGFSTENQINTWQYNNIHFKNSPDIGGATRSGYVNCIFENVRIVHSESQGGLVNCIVLANDVSLFNITRNSPNNNNNCLFFENMGAVNNLSSLGSTNFSFLVKNKTLRLNTSSANFTNNLINGLINFSGVDYELKFLFDGSPRPDANPAIPDFATAPGFSDCYTRGNFAGDPKFIDVLNRIVAPDSDLLKRSNANGFIGGVKAGRFIPVSSTEPNVTITTERINTSDPSNYVIATSEDDGWIDIKFRLSSQIVQASRINVDALLAFDGSVAGGTADNNNVPDATPEFYSPLSQPNLTPNRLVYLFRSSKAVNMPTTDAGWDNDNDTIGVPVVAGEFYPMEWGTVPSIRINSGVAYGNADFTAPGGVSNIPNVRWINIRVRLTNLRSYV